ncbi:hypothetical protein MMC07_002850 [Pseudocyphellaria aurata]|nr:hypothetical protein [Pseudocyphellaria aurata]
MKRKASIDDGPPNKRQKIATQSDPRGSSASQIVGNYDKSLPELSPTLQQSSRASDLAYTIPEFAVPYPRLGVLTPFPGSIVQKPISLYDRKLTYGRGPTSTVRFPNPNDMRVPLRAIRISWWCPHILHKIEQVKDWRTIDGLIPLVQTLSTQYILINGVKLPPHGTNCWNFGVLHTGDEISVFRPTKLRAKDKRGEFLAFRCEFFIGPNAKPREKPFVVEKHDKMS